MFLYSGLYLDHAGSTLYSQTQLNNCITELGKNCFGNPHSRNAPSKLTSDLIDQTRVELLEFFQADPNEFTLIFTSGATDSLRLVAESFQFSNNKSSLSDKCGSFIYMKESHTSVIGMREYFKDHVPCYAIPSDEILSDLHPTKHFTSLPISTENEGKVFSILLIFELCRVHKRVISGKRAVYLNGNVIRVSHQLTKT